MKNNLSKYSLAAASSLVGSSSAFGAIIYSGNVNLTLTYQDGDELYIDFEGQSAAIRANSIPADDFFISDYSSDDFSMYRISPDVLARSGSNLAEFSYGQEIGSGASFGSYGDLRDGSTFGTGTGQYAGVRLDSTNYGWLQLSFDQTNNTITLYDFAYDDSGAAILAGDTGVSPVPEPAETALGIALLAGAAVAYRRRRSK